MPQHGRWRLNSSPLPGGTSAHGLFLLSKSREVSLKYFFLLSRSSVSVQPLLRSHPDCSRNWYMRYSDFWAAFAHWFEARCLFNIRGVCPTVCEPLPLTRDLGAGYVLFQDIIQAWRELLKSFDSDLNFPYNCKKISTRSTHLFPLETNKMKNPDLKRVQFLKENFAEYSQQLKTLYILKTESDTTESPFPPLTISSAPSDSS